MTSPEDSTQVIRLLNDFEKYITSPRRSYSVEYNKEVVAKLDFNEDTTVGVSAVRQRLKRASSNPLIQTDSLEKQKLIQQVNESKKRKRETEKELLLAKSSVSKLEAQITSSESCNRRTKFDLEKHLADMTQERNKEKERSDDLNHQLKQLARREEYYHRKLAEAKQEITTNKINFESKSTAYEKEKCNLQTKLSDMRDLLQKTIAENDKRCDELRNEVKNNEDVIDFYKVQISKKDERYEEIKADLADVADIRIEYQRAQQKIRDLENELMKQEEVVKLASILKSKADKYPDLEQENKELRKESRYLRDLNDRRLLLEEQHEGLLHKTARLEENLANYNSVIMKNESLTEQLQDWVKACAKIIDEPTPTMLKSTVNRLFQTEALLTSQVGALKTEIHMTEVKLQQSESTVAKLEQKVKSALDLDGDRCSIIRRLQKKLFLVTAERDSYRKLLNSYENEMTINPNVQSAERIQELERLLANYRQSYEKLESDLTGSKNPTATTTTGTISQGSSIQHKKELDDKDAVISSLKDENKILQQRIDEIISSVGYDPSSTKVMTFSMNPTSVAIKKNIDEAEELKETNEKLRQRIKLLEEKKGEEVEDITVQVDQRLEQQGSVKSREELQEKLTSAEMKTKKMMDAFRKTTNEFREVIYMLLGFKVDIPRSNFYKLSSMYAESPDDYLLFEMTNDGVLQLLESDFSKTVTDLIENYLQRQGSIPTFLSMLTMDLFSKQTVAIVL